LCDRNIAINFGVVAGEVILVDSCAVIIICCVIVIYFVGKKMLLVGGIVQVLFKTKFLVELGLDLLFPKGK
jgi:type IV secretory pathway TrbD component